MNGDFARVLLAAIVALAAGSVPAGPDPMPITAEQAFDAVTMGVDPVTGKHYSAGQIVIVDVRTPPEYQFQGTAGKVDHILLRGDETPVVPDLGKALLTPNGRYLEYRVDGEARRTGVGAIAELVTSAIATNVPCATWNEQTTEMDPAPDRFRKGIGALAEAGVKVVISMCNSGGRSTACLVKFVPDDIAARFDAFYEIDRHGDGYLNPEHKVHLAGLGGFQGSVYDGVYNGYSGFVGRDTGMQPDRGWRHGRPRGPSVSWKDSGLPGFIPETSCNLPDQPRTP